MTGRRDNRLARETSPYLLQHAQNPVDWWAWGSPAIDEARRLDRPILLSIGYSTCYWCHVMERESFESEALAALVNASFVPIKVDREERPDLDEAYMAATQLVTGRGGWPMTAFLEPAGLRPFWCGTYLPPEPRGGMPSFGQVLEAIAEAWRERRGDVNAQAERIGIAVAEHMSRPPASAIGVAQIEQAVASLLSIFDRVNGGFGREPKFPQPSILGFLLDVRAGAGEESTRAAIDEAVRGTLDAMARGGIRDHAGGGFHRYAVDARWTVPHFEKMLTDNAALAEAFARAGVIHADPWYRAISIQACEFIVSVMGNPGGGFAAAIDAEAQGREGVGYVWSRADLERAVGPEDAAFAVDVYGLAGGPNFRDPHHPEAPAMSVLVLADRPERVAARMGIDAEEFDRRLSRVNRALRRAREAGPSPRIDRTVIAAWNGQAIWALARCGSVLDRPEFVAAAGSAAEFMLRRLRGIGGELRRTFRDGSEVGEGFLEDYAWAARGLLALFEASRDSRWSDAAIELLERAIARFGDTEGGFLDASESAELFVRPRSASDGAADAPSAVMIHAMLDAFDATDDRVWLVRAAGALQSLSPEIAAAPAACASASAALFRLLVEDSTLGAELARGASAPASAEPRPEEFSPVQVFAGVDRLLVGRDEPAVFDLVLRIAPGYHITAADPGLEGLAPLRVGITGGSGARVFADYPPGTPWSTDPRAMVHEGTVEFRVVVERDGPWSGRPLLTVSFQACSERECLAPSAVELDIALDPA